MAKAKDNVNPHFLGRYRPAAYNLRPELYLTTYSARERMSDLIRLTCERANSGGVNEVRKAILKTNAQQLESAFKTFADLSEARQHELMAIAWASYHIGANDPGLGAATIRDAAIKKLWESGLRPSENVLWKEFRGAVIKESGAQTTASVGGENTELLKRGFGLRQIQRRVRELKEAKVLV
jgi:hypothetical protein